MSRNSPNLVQQRGTLQLPDGAVLRWCLGPKGYPHVYTSGPYRNKKVHILVMEAALGRKLRRDEEVHHRDHNRLNYDISNLTVIDKVAHGWVSKKQHWFMANIKEPKDKHEWEDHWEWMRQQARRDGVDFEFGAMADGVTATAPAAIPDPPPAAAPAPTPPPPSPVPAARAATATGGD